MRRDLLIAAILTAVVLSVYAYTAAPGVTLVDSGEFVLACQTLGIGHPPGVPTYILLGHLFSFLPLGSIARRMNLFSSVSAALAVGLAYLLMRRLLGGSSRLPALAGAILFAFSAALWHWSAVTEVYALNILLITLALLLASYGRWISGALVIGLALGVHHVSVLTAVPAAAYLAWTEHRPSRRTAEWALAAGLAGLSVYAYLPIRAAQSPLLNWGEPRDWDHFWWHVTGRQYRALDGSLIASYWDNVKVLGHQVVSQWPWPCLIVAACGLALLIARRNRMAWFAGALALINCSVTVAAGLGGPDVSGYYLPTILALSCCFAAGCAEKLFGKWAMVPVALLVSSPLVFGFRAADRHNDRVATLAVENSFKGVEPGSLILTIDWNHFYAPWLTMHHAEGFRPDVAVVNTAMLRLGWYAPLLKRQYPGLAQEVAPELAEYAKRLDSWEHGTEGPDTALALAFGRLVNAMIDRQFEHGRKVYLTVRMERNFLPTLEVVPHGLLWVYGSEAGDVDLDLSGLLGDVALDESSERLRADYATMLGARAQYLQRHGREQDAARLAALARKLDASTPAPAVVYSLSPYQVNRMKALMAKQGGVITQGQADAIARDGR